MHEFYFCADGKAIRGDGTECFEAPTAQGVVAEVAGGEVDSIVVWDPDATPCNPGSYVHYAAEGKVENFEPMTAGAGAVVHVYHAAMFLQGLPLTTGTTGCVKDSATWESFAAEECFKSWQVARFGNACPLPPPPTKSSSKNTVLFVLLLFSAGAAAFWKRQALYRHIFSPRTKTQAYIALSTIATH